MESQNAFSKMWNDTNAQIEKNLRARGETFLPGDPGFDAITGIISENRKSRDEFEKAMSTPILNWNHTL